MREALFIRSIRHANVMNAKDYFWKLYGSVVRRPVAPALIAIHLLKKRIARTGIMLVIWLIPLVLVSILIYFYLRNLSNVRNKISTCDKCKKH
jgi:nitrate/nitrite transporter NarK